MEVVFNEFKKEDEEWKRPLEGEWNLRDECKMSETMMIIIAKARWKHHTMRCRMANAQRYDMNTMVLIDQTKREMRTWKKMKDSNKLKLQA